MLIALIQIGGVHKLRILIRMDSGTSVNMAKYLDLGLLLSYCFK